jgi:putative glycosyltransferase (TIGR04372 family)
VFLFGAYILNRSIPGGEKYLVNLPSESFDFRVLDNSPGPLIPDLEFELQGEQLFSKLGIKSESTVVCFYIRDGMYGRKKFPNLDQEFADYRDSDIGNFVPAMEFLAEQGFTVIRMGREGISPVNSKHPNVIDYCFSAHKSDFADFFLTSKAEFAICTDTGMTHFPLFFRKPIAIANIAGMHGLLHTKMVKFITFKRCFDKRLMRNLSLSEILNSDLLEYKDSYRFYNAGITFVESNSNELIGLVKDMVDCNASSEFLNNTISELNIDFQDLVFAKRKIKMWSSISHTWLQNNRDFLK